MKKTQPIEGKGMRNSVLKVNVVGRHICLFRISSIHVLELIYKFNVLIDKFNVC